MRLGRVFVSSVFGGMMDLRRSAAEAAALLGLEPVLTEKQIAQPGTVRDALGREIAGCDIYLGLFAQRRGTVPPSGTVDFRAITEEEFRLARELGLRCLVFLSKDGAREPGLAEFLEREVSDYATGVWARPYDSPPSLRREMVAALSAVRPRVVLALGATGRGLEGQARLFLGGLKPAWTGEAVLGPVPFDLNLGAGTKGVFSAFRRGPLSRNSLRDADLRAAGGDLAGRALPGPLGEALAAALDLAAGRLVTVEIRSGVDAVLALPWELLSLSRHPLPVQEGKIEILRRLVLPGDADDPAQDSAPAVPPEHLAVLGFTASPIEDQQEGVRLGREGGRVGDSDLFWEQEQERLLVALDGLLREGRGRLILPDTGDKEELRAQLARTDRPQVVHISCHGGPAAVSGGPPLPALFLEDKDGHRAPLTGPELLSWVRATPGAGPLGLLVLSACSTAGAAVESTPGPGVRAGAAMAEAVSEAAEETEAAGLAESLVRGGLPRVLGMQSTVTDSGATAFAEGLYGALGRGTDLAIALRAGRAELAARGGPHEWAIPTLTLRGDAGPLAAPEGSAARVATPFEAAREQFRIAGVAYLGKGYVGRRDIERRLRGAFHRGERVIVIHGLGGIGKSTLAARFLERRRAEGARVLVLYAGRVLAPATLLDEIAAQVGVARPSGLPPGEAEARFRGELGKALREVVPTLLLLDNFEDNQDPDGQLLNAELGIALLDLARLGGTTFRLLITSRLSMELPPSPVEAVNLDLGEISRSGCRKLRLLDPEGLGRLDDDAWQEALRRFGGHPKALELLGGYLRSKPDRAKTLLKKLDSAVQAVGGKLSAKDQERGRSLLVDTVLGSVPEERLPSLDRLCLLDQPLPTEELEALLAAEEIADPGDDLSWFRDHGLLARAVAPSALTGGDLVHRLLADRRRNSLAEREGVDAARAWHLRVAGHFVERPGPLSDLGAAARHRDAAGDRAGALELYNRWALQLRDRHAYAACIQIAREGLEAFPISDNEVERVRAASLWGKVHQGLESLGDRKGARVALEKASLLVINATSSSSLYAIGDIRLLQGRFLVGEGRIDEAALEFEAANLAFREGGFQREQAIVLGDVARLRAQSGDVSGALALHEERLRVYESLGDVRSRAVTLGDVARLRAQSGDVSGALALHEERLRVYESLGDVRSRAVTLGDVARLRAQSGDVSGALALHEEMLGIFESLGDVRERAVTLGDVARLRAQSGDVSGALALHEERLGIYESLGDVRSRAVTLGDVARLRAQSGDVSGALALHEERLGIFESLGDVRERAVTLGDVARLRAQSGDVSGALALQLERLKVNRKLGDVDGIAAAQYDLATLDFKEERFDEARPRLAEAWRIFQQIGRADGIAIVGSLYGQLLVGTDRAQALTILRTSREAFQRLGWTQQSGEIDALLQSLEEPGES